MIYSLEFRQKVVNSYKKIKNKAKVARNFEINVKTVTAWINKNENGESLRYVKKGSIKLRKIQDLEKFQKLMEKFPSATLHERTAIWEKETGQKVSFMAIKRLLVVIGFTHKRNASYYKEACPIKREKYLEKIKNIPKEKIFYADEAGFVDDENTRYVWGQKGKRIIIPKQGFTKKKSMQ
jgi:transposase